MGVVYLAYCGSWQLSLHVPCFCAFYILNTTPNPTSSSFFRNVFVLVIFSLILTLACGQSVTVLSICLCVCVITNCLIISKSK